MLPLLFGTPMNLSVCDISYFPYFKLIPRNDECVSANSGHVPWHQSVLLPVSGTDQTTYLSYLPVSYYRARPTRPTDRPTDQPFACLLGDGPINRAGQQGSTGTLPYATDRPVKLNQVVYFVPPWEVRGDSCLYQQR